MRIAWIGGLDRNQGELQRLAAQRGHLLDFHTGNTHGRGASELRAIVERANFVIILTDVNSHGGVLLAKRTSSKAGKGALVMRKCGRARFVQLLEALDIRHGRLRVAS